MNALRSERLEVQQWCPNCHQEQEVEDEFHAIVSCPLAKNVWCIFSIEGDRCRDYNFIAKLVERTNLKKIQKRDGVSYSFGMKYLATTSWNKPPKGFVMLMRPFFLTLTTQVGCIVRDSQCHLISAMRKLSKGTTT